MGPIRRAESGTMQKFLQQACLVAVNPIRSACIVGYRGHGGSNEIHLVWGEVEFHNDRLIKSDTDLLKPDLFEDPEFAGIVVFVQNRTNGYSLESTMKLWHLDACPTRIWTGFPGLWELPLLDRGTPTSPGCTQRAELDHARARILATGHGAVVMAWFPDGDEPIMTWYGKTENYDTLCDEFISSALDSCQTSGDTMRRQVVSCDKRCTQRPWYVTIGCLGMHELWSTESASPESVAEWKRVVDSCRAAGFPVDMIWRNGE